MIKALIVVLYKLFVSIYEIIWLVEAKATGQWINLATVIIHCIHACCDEIISGIAGRSWSLSRVDIIILVRFASLLQFASSSTTTAPLAVPYICIESSLTWLTCNDEYSSNQLLHVLAWRRRRYPSNCRGIVHNSTKVVLLNSQTIGRRKGEVEIQLGGYFGLVTIRKRNDCTMLALDNLRENQTQRRRL